MPNRHGQDDDYRYGFNGMEKDDEVRGTKGASYNFGARMLDPRIGRWLSGDPLEAKYPSMSTYSFVANSPLLFVDPDGKQIVIYGNKEKVKKISKQLAMIYATKKGKKMLDEIILSPKTFQVKDLSAFWAAANGDRYSEQNDRTLSYDADATTTLNTDVYLGDVNPVVTLMHELQHMHDDATNYADDWNTIPSTGDMEKRGMSSGNYMRSVLGFGNMRTMYDAGFMFGLADADYELKGKDESSYNSENEKVMHFSMSENFDFEESTANRRYYIVDFTKTENASDGSTEDENGKDMLYYCTKSKNSDSQRNAVTITLTPNKDEKK